jgi:hypothetical protein
MNPKIPQEIEEKILKDVEEDKELIKWTRDNKMQYRVQEKDGEFIKELTTKMIKKAISLAFKAGQKQTLEKVKREIDERLRVIFDKSEYEMLEDYEDLTVRDKVRVEELDKINKFLSKLEDDEVGK